MSYERIDLSQFDGMKEWEVEKRPDGGYAIKTGRDNFSLEEAETIAKLTTLIPELMRCYETIDYLALHAHVTGNFCPMCLTYLTERCQHIIWAVDVGVQDIVHMMPNYRTTFSVYNEKTDKIEEHVYFEPSQDYFEPSEEE